MLSYARRPDPQSIDPLDQHWIRHPKKHKERQEQKQQSPPASPTVMAARGADGAHFEQVQEQYMESLQRALDRASSLFMRNHPSLSSDEQKQLVAAWAEAQRRRPHRPADDAHHDDEQQMQQTQRDATDDEARVNGEGKKKKVVRAYIDGCYDLMHSGHYNAIRQAKSLCDELIVGIHTNEEIMRQKGPPVMSDEERLATVQACKWVDRVEFGTPYNPTIELLDSLGADFAVHGDDDCANAEGVDAFAAVKAAGRMAIVKRTEGVSTTDLVNRLLQLTSDQSGGTPPDLPPTTTPPLAHALTASSPQLVHDAARAANSDHSKGGLATVAPDASSPPLPPPRAMSTFLSTTWRISQFANHRVPKRTDKVVYIAGSFDLFHLGHIQKLEAAKKLGTFLYVGVYDDATVAHYKGRHHPVMSVHERVLNVLQCVHVDEVVIGAPFDITHDLIKTLNVAVVARCKPCDASVRRTGHLLPDPAAAVQSLGVVRDIATASDLHTDQVIQRILDNRAKYEARNEKRTAKEHAYAAQKKYVEEK